VLRGGGLDIGILVAEALEEQSTNKFSFILTQKCQSIVLMQLQPKLPGQTRMAIENDHFRLIWHMKNTLALNKVVKILLEFWKYLKYNFMKNHY